jgi:FkbM family methyltransferase
MSFLTDSSLLGGFIRRPYFHARRLLAEHNYRTIAWLRMRHGFTKRYREKRIHAFGVDYRVPDVASFLSALDEIYGDGIYGFVSANNAPVIVDIGANVGVSVNYFLASHPGARIYAYEADPAIFDCLKNNVADRNDRVELFNQAVWNQNTSLRFAHEGADGGRISGDGGIDVQAVDIREVLADKQIDLLKIDIEGAEEVVLPACAGSLDNVERVFLEYHSNPDSPQRLGEIAGLLNDAGFRLHVRPVSYSRAPFVKLELSGGFDMQLNIFAWRERAGVEA